MAPLPVLQGAAQFLDLAFHGDDGRGGGRIAYTGREHLRARVPQQKLRLAGRPSLAEELCRDVRDLMRLIENDGLGARQQIAEAFVLERKIREQQVVIHHDDVGGLGVAPRLEHMAARELGALRSQAVFAGRGDLRPQRGLFGQIGELR